MANVRVELDRAGVSELMRSPEIEMELEKAAEPVMGILPEGYSKELRKGITRSNVRIWTDSVEAAKDNAENDTLLKAVNACSK